MQVSCTITHKKESRCWDLLEDVQTNMEIQEQSLYDCNELESEYLVCPALIFNTAWTLLGKLSLIYLSSLQE